MKNKNFLMVAFFATALHFTCKAQTFSEEMLNKYPPSVISRLAEIIVHVPLNYETKLKIATLYSYEDSIVTQALMQGAQAIQIVNIKEQTWINIQKLFSASQLGKYYHSLCTASANFEAKAKASLVASNLSADTSFEHKLYTLYFNQRLKINEELIKDANDSLIQDKLKAVLIRFDSLEQKTIEKVRLDNYINNRIIALDIIKPLQPSDKQKLENLFLNLAKTSKNSSYNDNFSDAMHRSITDTVYYGVLYKEKITHTAVNNVPLLTRSYVSKYQLSKDGASKLSPLIYEREKRMATIALAFPSVNKIGYEMKSSTEAYYDSLISRVLIYDGAEGPKSQFKLAIKHKKLLSLTKDQVDLLVVKALELQDLKNSYKKKNEDDEYASRNFECTQMQKALTEDQYDKFLSVKNNEPAIKDAIEIWKELKQRALTQTYDSTTVVPAIKKYQLAKRMTKDRYDNDKIRQSANLKTIDNIMMPEPVRKLNAARKNNNSNDKASNGSFKW